MAGPWAWSTGNTTAPPTTTPKPTDTPAGPAVPLKVEKVPEPPKDPLEQYPLFETTRFSIRRIIMSYNSICSSKSSKYRPIIFNILNFYIFNSP